MADREFSTPSVGVWAGAKNKSVDTVIAMEDVAARGRDLASGGPEGIWTLLRLNAVLYIT